nr:MAG TPA: hypothetical protein [Caudoviricetes sp.]
MNRTAEQNRQAERQGRQHEIRAKIALRLPLNSRERSFYLLFMATAEQTAEFIRNENKAI